MQSLKVSFHVNNNSCFSRDVTNLLSAMFEYKFVELSLSYFGFMSDTFLSDSRKDKVVTEQNTVEKSSIVLSEYVKGLGNHVRCRYMQKIEAINIDPATLDTSHLDPECLPPIEAGDLVSYLVLETSFYTLKQFKNFKSLQAYNQVISGFVMSVQGKVISDLFVVIGKVRRSQKMNDPLIKVWIITNKEGVIASAHCFDCLAGLAESCSHIASTLFYIEAWTRIHGKLACTQVKCTHGCYTHLTRKLTVTLTVITNPTKQSCKVKISPMHM